MSTKQSEKNDPEIGTKRRKLSNDEKSASSANKKFRSSGHAKNTLKILESYFKDKQLTDVILITSSKRIDAHRLILSASSSYFATKFKSSLEKSIPNEIDMKEIDEAALLALVEYCYTGSIDLREDNVAILFETARLLKMDPVLEACKPYLEKQLNPRNCLGIRTFADSRRFESLSRVAHDYALEYFVQVVQNQEFLLLSADRVAEFLKSDDVNVPSEETIFNALTTWLKHDSIHRIKDASKLLSYVKLPLLTPEFIADHIEGNELFNDQKDIQDSICEAYRYHLLRKPTDSQLKSGHTRPRKSTVDILVSFGHIYEGRDPSSSSKIDAFDLRKDTWTNLTTMTCREGNFGAVCFKEKLFVVGGKLNDKSTKGVKIFDFPNQVWETWPSMQTCRNGVGVGILNDFLYAVGGRVDLRDFTNTVERCDLDSQKWSSVAPMTTKRFAAGVAVLNNKLYVVGGWDGSYKSKTMECYDPRTDKWTFCSPMSQARAQVGIGVLNGHIYAIGGYGEERFLNSVERYDPETDKWTTIASMNVARENTGVGVVGHRLFVVGGYDGFKRLRLVEAYDPVLDKWEELAALEEGRAGPCVVVDRTICKL